MSAPPAPDVVELVSKLIQNACVNCGTPDSGGEVRSAETLADYLQGIGLQTQVFEPEPGRRSLVIRWRGTDPAAPSLCLMGHTDVVPADPADWDVDPFCGEIRDGYIWGRGALDMLNQTAAQAGALKRLADDGFEPRGDLVFFAAADEEAGGALGTEWIMDNEPSALEVDYVITEGGGFVFPDFGSSSSSGTQSSTMPTIGVMVGEKGPVWRELRFRGRSGHASVPYRMDNALSKAVDAIKAIEAHGSTPRITDEWRRLVACLDLKDDLGARLMEPETVDDAIAEIAETHPSEAAIFDAQTRNTYVPNMIAAGTKVNVIANRATLTLDSRVLPGVGIGEIRAELSAILGHLAQECEITELSVHEATSSTSQGPFWSALETSATGVFGECRLAPWTAPFATDARFFRKHGTIAYGFTLHDRRLDLASWLELFHGRNERVSIEAIENATEFYTQLARSVVG